MAPTTTTTTTTKKTEATESPRKTNNRCDRSRKLNKNKNIKKKTKTNIKTHQSQNVYSEFDEFLRIDDDDDIIRVLHAILFPSNNTYAAS